MKRKTWLSGAMMLGVAFSADAVAAPGSGTALGLKCDHYQFRSDQTTYPDFTPLVTAPSPPAVPWSSRTNFTWDVNESTFSRLYYFLDLDGTNIGGKAMGSWAPELYHFDNCAFRWSGKLKVKTAGSHGFDLRNRDWVRVYLDDVLLFDRTAQASDTIVTGETSRVLSTGLHDLRLELHNPPGDSEKPLILQLDWEEPGGTMTNVPEWRLFHTYPAPDDDLDDLATEVSAYIQTDLAAYHAAVTNPANEDVVNRDRVAYIRARGAEGYGGGTYTSTFKPTQNAGAGGANYGYRNIELRDFAGSTDSPVGWDFFFKTLHQIHTYETQRADGMRPDGLWMQHNVRGAQIHVDGYGKDALKRRENYLDSTRWAFRDDSLDALADYCITADWFMYKDVADDNIRGRWNFKTLGSGLYSSLATIANDGLTDGTYDTVTRNALQAARDRFVAAGSPTTPLTGNRFFPSGLIGVHRTNDWYISTKVVSERVAGPESFAWAYRPNVQYGIGYTMILRDGDEQALDFKPNQNHSALAGITYEYDTDFKTIDFHGYRSRTNQFAGGLSDDSAGLAAFHYDVEQNSDVTAYKSYFFIPEGLVAMGCNINMKSSRSENVFTTLNQTSWRSTISYYIGASEVNIPTNSGPVDLSLNVSSTSWFYHNGVGYIVVPGGTARTVRLIAESRTNTYTNMTTLATETNPVTVAVFHLAIDHGVNPSDDDYLYYVLPGISKYDLPGLVASLPVEVLQNDSSIQAVRDTRHDVLYGVFHEAATLTGPGGTIATCDKPVLLMQRDQGAIENWTLADPINKYHGTLFEMALQAEDVVSVTVPGTYTNAAGTVSNITEGAALSTDGTNSTIRFYPPIGFDGNREGESVALTALDLAGAGISLDPGVIRIDVPRSGGLMTQDVQIVNVGNGSLRYTIEDNAEWISIEPPLNGNFEEGEFGGITPGGGNDTVRGWSYLFLDPPGGATNVEHTLQRYYPSGSESPEPSTSNAYWNIGRASQVSQILTNTIETGKTYRLSALLWGDSTSYARTQLAFTDGSTNDLVFATTNAFSGSYDQSAIASNGTTFLVSRVTDLAATNDRVHRPQRRSIHRVQPGHPNRQRARCLDRPPGCGRRTDPDRPGTRRFLHPLGRGRHLIRRPGRHRAHLHRTLGQRHKYTAIGHAALRDGRNWVVLYGALMPCIVNRLLLPPCHPERSRGISNLLSAMEIPRQARDDIVKICPLCSGKSQH